MGTIKMIINVLVDLLKLFVKTGFFNKLMFVSLVNLVLLIAGMIILIKNREKKNIHMPMQ